MVWNGFESAEELEKSLESGDIERGRALVDDYVAQIDDRGQIGDEKTIRRVLTVLRNYTLFDELQALGQRIKNWDPDNPRARTLYAQALIDQGSVTKAIQELIEIKETLEDTIEELRGRTRPAEIKERDDAKGELYEVFGLLGRAYKQLYVDAKPNKAEPRTSDLDLAVNFYAKAFRENATDNYWHGVNLMALKTHHERTVSGKPKKRSREAGDTAEVVLEALEELEEKRKPLGPWELASRAEAHLALCDYDKAIESTQQYLDHAQLNRFALQGTLRQFQQLWGLDEKNPPGNHLIPMMRARLAQLPGGRIEIEIEPGFDYEGVWGDVSYQPIEWLKLGLERSRSVARLGRSLFDGSGTGWLFDGSWLGPKFEGKPLVLTNAHVCTSDEKVRESLASLGYDVLPPEDAVVGFLGAATEQNPPEPYDADELFTSPPQDLDATLLLLSSAPDGIEPFPRATTAVQSGDRVNIIGHPHGKRLSVSLQDNEVTGIEEKYLYYKTPTDPGSSGSPIFNQDWELVGLHHASKKTKMANEGIHLDRIIDALRKALA
ncbi:MAG: hypothetical protein E2P02_04660 [Acidobacteria bacterium]|nr:MAG: hypothetical protein E2P02_04660 [Acidobacteriota bacterium]